MKGGDNPNPFPNPSGGSQIKCFSLFIRHEGKKKFTKINGRECKTKQYIVVNFGT